MIFKQIREIIEGTKTQTRRIRKEGEVAYAYSELYSDRNTTYTVMTRPPYEGGRIKWQVGRQYAVQPKLGMPQVYYKYVTSYTGELECLFAHDETTYGGSPLDTAKSKTNWRYELMLQGWKPLSIKITDIRCEPLQNITEADAIAEGIQTVATMVPRTIYKDYLPNDRIGTDRPIDSYRTLWESINGDGSWDENPDVWVLDFEVVAS